jgi:hypothetical protein
MKVFVYVVALAFKANRVNIMFGNQKKKQAGGVGQESEKAASENYILWSLLHSWLSKLLDAPFHCIHKLLYTVSVSSSSTNHLAIRTPFATTINLHHHKPAVELVEF